MKTVAAMNSINMNPTHRGKKSTTLLEKYRKPRWWERENKPYRADYRVRNEYADWVTQVDWRLICTLTFAWQPNDERASKTFDAFINRLEHALKADVCYVRGDEKRFSGCGKPACGRHYHVLMTSVAPMHPAFVEWLWRSMAGNRSDYAGAQVEPYNPGRWGAKYVLKFISKPEGDWAFRNLHLFHPEARNLQTPTARQRRQIRRHKDRLKKLGSA